MSGQNISGGCCHRLRELAQGVKRTNTWQRDEPQLAHLFRFESRNGSVQVQWGVLSESVLPDLWLAPPARRHRQGRVRRHDWLAQRHTGH